MLLHGSGACGTCGTLHATLAFRIQSNNPSLRFLGSSVAERNERVVERAGSLASRAESRAPLLVVPSGAAITPALLDMLPPLGMWHLTWDPRQPPLVWRSSDGLAPHVWSTASVPNGAVLDVSTGAARRRAAWRLLQRAGKPTDGWL